LTLFRTRLSDAIVRQNFALPDGSTRYFTQGDTLLVTANTNANQGIIQGLSAYADIKINKKFQLYTSINVQQGEAKDQDNSIMPLGHIPPTFGRSSLKYDADWWQVSFDWRYNGWKRIEDFGGSVDNPDQATEDGSPAWNLFGINAQFKLKEMIQLQLGVDNLLDTHYRPFSSGLSAPGRHVVIALRYQL